MPRNDQVTRQWLLLRKLEQSRGATLQELAASLPEDLSRHHRTVRRDLEALEAAGVPLVTERRNARTFTCVQDSVRLPSDDVHSSGAAIRGIPDSPFTGSRTGLLDKGRNQPDQERHHLGRRRRRGRRVVRLLDAPLRIRGAERTADRQYRRKELSRLRPIWSDGR